MNLRKCLKHGYTLKESCPVCKKPTLEAHYKYPHLKSAKEALVK